jgi:pyruvate/2-oxoglutarate dehydrogenase complex dihydrolipoamide acyltransferase (E2) component
MIAIHVDDALWASATDPEGILLRWLVQEGERSEAGQALAEVLIEGARHEIVSPAAGLLVWAMTAGELIEPGVVIGELQ